MAGHGGILRMAHKRPPLNLNTRILSNEDKEQWPLFDSPTAPSRFLVVSRPGVRRVQTSGIWWDMYLKSVYYDTGIKMCIQDNLWNINNANIISKGMVFDSRVYKSTSVRGRDRNDSESIVSEHR